ncbi:ArsR/SmtB family transcription factor [Gallaecimonas mangrovi]|uniref:ArsR/SmtB family transcription factor n=1 Tax=Gallaecimonas mangrovi TaxID=2291597 RepID=UPI000E1FB97F|nr:metalloregulator ArsR/SmtB family transcription factor [Gallaecimonas mangrovi]
MRERYHPKVDEMRIERLMQAFAEPVRLRILALLAEQGETACSNAYATLGLSKANASHHFRILREAGAIKATMHGRELHTQIRYEDLEKRFPGLLAAVLAGFS